MTWTITAGDGTELATGKLEAGTLPQGELSELGTIKASLNAADAPAELEVSVVVEGEEADDGSSASLRTASPIWVYPAKPEPRDDEAFTLSRRFDRETRERLEDGETVLLWPESGALRSSLDGSFQPDFWNYVVFKQNGKPGTLGMATDADHPVFGSFPTADHADWQWWSVLRHARPIVLDDAPAEFDPTVQIIDTIYRNHKLGVYLETAVGDGRLAVCSLDFAGDDPATRQFRHSLGSYLASDAFDPDLAVSAGVLESLFDAGRDGDRRYGDDAGAWVEHE